MQPVAGERRPRADVNRWCSRGASTAGARRQEADVATAEGRRCLGEGSAGSGRAESLPTRRVKSPISAVGFLAIWSTSATSFKPSKTMLTRVEAFDPIHAYFAISEAGRRAGTAWPAVPRHEPPSRSRRIPDPLHGAYRREGLPARREARLRGSGHRPAIRHADAARDFS